MVNSGTSALWLAVDLLGCEPGDEVITSPLTFSSDIAPLVRNGIVPAFVDVEPDTYQIDVEQDRGDDRPAHQGDPHPEPRGQLPRLGRASARSPTGTACSWSRTAATCSTPTCAARAPDLRADIAVTSFARSHSITAAGNGGMIAVDDPEWFDQTLVRRRWGRRSETYLFGSRKGSDDRFGPLADGTPYDLIFVFDDMGYNFEPSEIMAAYGLVQMDKLAEFNERRQQHIRGARRGARPPRRQGRAAPHDPEVRDHVDALPVPARRRHRPHGGAGVLPRAQHPDPHGLDRQHPAPAGLRQHRPPRTRRRPAQRRPGHGPGPLAAHRTTASPATTSATWSTPHQPGSTRFSVSTAFVRSLRSLTPFGRVLLVRLTPPISDTPQTEQTYATKEP